MLHYTQLIRGKKRLDCLVRSASQSAPLPIIDVSHIAIILRSAIANRQSTVSLFGWIAIRPSDREKTCGSYECKSTIVVAIAALNFVSTFRHVRKGEMPVYSQKLSVRF